MSKITTITQILSISTALIASGGIATLTLFDVPELQSQPSSRSLPSIRWLFSRGSHIFPQASALSTLGFSYLAYTSLPTTTIPSSRPPLLNMLLHGKVPFYIAAALLTISIAPVTTFMMIPTNFKLIKLNEDKGGARSARSAQQLGDQPGVQGRTAEDSVAGEGQAEEFTDLSGPQTKTKQDSTEEEDQEVNRLLGEFGRLNAIRAVAIGLGGVVGLATALM